MNEEMPAWATGWQYFRPRVEGSFLRFFWSPNHRTWRVQDKSGVTMELGVPLDDANYTIALEIESRPARARSIAGTSSASTTLTATRIQRRATQPVNVVVYRYAQDGGMAYLSDIFDTPPASGPRRPRR